MPKVAGGGKVLAISQQGQATVLAAGDTLRILARNDLEAQVMATPALVQAVSETAAEVRDAFARRHQGLEPVSYAHPSLEPLLADTYGLMAYEEHILLVANGFAGIEVIGVSNISCTWPASRSVRAGALPL